MNKQLKFLLKANLQKDLEIYRKKISKVKGIPLITYDKKTEEYKIDFSSIGERNPLNWVIFEHIPLKDNNVANYHIRQEDILIFHEQMLSDLSQRFPQMAENLNETTWQYWQMLQNYAEFRKYFNYYKEAFRIAMELRSEETGTVIDVGVKNSTVVLEMFGNGYEKTAMDNDFPKGFKPIDKNIRILDADLFTYNIKTPYNIVMCQQVLEHLDDPQKAFSHLEVLSNDVVVISVPYGSWHKTQHDPIDKEKVKSWTGRTPELESVVEDFGVKRYVAGYKGGKESAK